jgi:UDP-N-acetylmuramate--alanine ligase
MKKANANLAAKTRVHLTTKTKVHFMGIGGSGMSAAALIAKGQGYFVSGCDLLKHTPYIEKVKEAGVEVYFGHDREHVSDVDIVCVTPSVFYQNKSHPEVIAGRRKKLMTWQQFLGEYLQVNKYVIGITGTHGKSTTTSMAALLLEEAGFDPTVQVGATVREWEANYRFGKSKYFLNEADEFYGNFLHYKPEIIVLNNIEFDHPDYFKSEDHVVETFTKFTNNLVGHKTLIFNQDSEGIKKLFNKLGSKKLKAINLIGYTISNSSLIKTENSFNGRILKMNTNGTEFIVENRKQNFDDDFRLKLPGKYNVSNALGVIALSNCLMIDKEKVKKVLSNFSGSGRRLELIGDKNGIKVYDDYAHHPTAIKATLEGIRQLNPDNRIICVVEPHMYSRTKRLLSEYEYTFKNADKVIIAPIYKSRDTSTFGINGKSIIKTSKHDDIKAFDTAEEVVDECKNVIKSGDVIIVMGAGDSYQLSRDILKAL